MDASRICPSTDEATRKAIIPASIADDGMAAARTRKKTGITQVPCELGRDIIRQLRPQPQHSKIIDFT
eukprot:3667110-Amphidinium_carterae.2